MLKLIFYKFLKIGFFLKKKAFILYILIALCYLIKKLLNKYDKYLNLNKFEIDLLNTEELRKKLNEIFSDEEIIWPNLNILKIEKMEDPLPITILLESLINDLIKKKNFLSKEDIDSINEMYTKLINDVCIEIQNTIKENLVELNIKYEEKCIDIINHNICGYNTYISNVFGVYEKIFSEMYISDMNFIYFLSSIIIENNIDIDNNKLSNYVKNINNVDNLIYNRLREETLNYDTKYVNSIVEKITNSENNNDLINNISPISKLIEKRKIL